MNKKILMMFGVMALLVATPVMATVCPGCSKYVPKEDRWWVTQRIMMQKKDPTTWVPFPKKNDDGSWNPTGVLLGFMGKRVMFHGKHLLTDTGYTLIYYGDETHNDIWPYATCIVSGTSSKIGTIRLTEKYDFKSFFGDGKAQKFWLVLSSDIDCNAKQMTAWNPTEYLFEHHTI